jgi:hypothetical protein
MASRGLRLTASIPVGTARRKKLFLISIVSRYPVGSYHLTPEQASKVFDSLGPVHRYLDRLIVRMDHTPIRNCNPKLYRLVRPAGDGLHPLWVELHYRSCGHGVDRLPTD